MTAVGVAALDANVLVPIVACDFLLAAFDHALYEPVVSAAVLDEVERTLLQDFPHIDPEGLRRRVGYMRVALVDHTIETIGADVADIVNPKDRHIVGAAVAGEAVVLVSEDGRLREEIASSGLSLESVTGDSFAMRLWHASPDEVDDVVRHLIAKRRRRPVEPEELAAQLAAHFPTMSAAWLERFKR